MHTPRGILIFGANGSGKTTLARELARILTFPHMDIEDYHFAPADMPYTAPRPREECLALLRADMEKHGAFVLSAVTGDFGDVIPSWYALAVQLSAPVNLRMQRIEAREHARHGARILAGGDMHAQHRRFVDFAASRDLAAIDRWAQGLACPVMRVDGAADWRENAVRVAERYGG